MGDQINAGTRSGAVGIQGIQGIQGIMGDGYVGPVGPVGPQGVQGAIGLRGPQGNDGLMGVQGFTGAQGPAGPSVDLDWMKLKAIFAMHGITLQNGYLYCKKIESSTLTSDVVFAREYETIGDDSSSSGSPST